jgi:hypothetical protein
VGKSGGYRVAEVEAVAVAVAEMDGGAEVEDEMEDGKTEMAEVKVEDMEDMEEVEGRRDNQTPIVL